MMLINTKLGPSRIEGIGVFADGPVAKDTVLWRFVPGFDRRFTKEQVASLPPFAREYLATYAYLSKKSGLFVLCSDHGKHFNHSRTPNTSNRYEEGQEEVVTRAARDIRPDEELTADYTEFEKRESYFSPKVEVRQAKIGKGIFAIEPIIKGEVVLDFSTGPEKYLPPKEAAAYEKAGNHFIIQVGDELYLVATDGPERADFINHSCDPNCGIRGKVTVVAMRDIAPGEEITFDYMMTESWRWYKMTCLCRTPVCRGQVTGEDWKREGLQRKYEGYFSDYITRKIKRPSLYKLAARLWEKASRRVEYDVYRTRQRRARNDGKG